MKNKKTIDLLNFRVSIYQLISGIVLGILAILSTIFPQEIRELLSGDATPTATLITPTITTFPNEFNLESETFKLEEEENPNLEIETISPQPSPTSLFSNYCIKNSKWEFIPSNEATGLAIKNNCWQAENWGFFPNNQNLLINLRLTNKPGHKYIRAIYTEIAEISKISFNVNVNKLKTQNVSDAIFYIGVVSKDKLEPISKIEGNFLLYYYSLDNDKVYITTGDGIDPKNINNSHSQIFNFQQSHDVEITTNKTDVKIQIINIENKFAYGWSKKTNNNHALVIGYYFPRDYAYLTATVSNLIISNK